MLLSGNQISSTRGDVGRKAVNDHAKTMPLRFPPKLRERMEAVLRPGENRTAFIQRLILEEVERREREKAKEPKS